MVGHRRRRVPAELTYRQAADVQPFANTLVNMDLTGAQIKATLEQQWQPAGCRRVRSCGSGVSKGFTYTYDAGQAGGLPDHGHVARRRRRSTWVRRTR